MGARLYTYKYFTPPKNKSEAAMDAILNAPEPTDPKAPSELRKLTSDNSNPTCQMVISRGWGLSAGEKAPAKYRCVVLNDNRWMVYWRGSKKDEK